MGDQVASAIVCLPGIPPLVLLVPGTVIETCRSGGRVVVVRRIVVMERLDPIAAQVAERTSDGDVLVEVICHAPAKIPMGIALGPELHIGPER